MAVSETGGTDAAGAGDPGRGGADTGAAEQGVAAHGGAFRSLATRNFRLFATGQIVSNTGTWMQRIAQDWLVLGLTHGSGVAVGLTTGLQFLPLLLFGLWGGVIADRYPKRLTLMVTQTTMSALALILGVLAISGTAQLWHVYVLAFGLGLATVVDNPTRQTFVVEMVGKRELPNAIALNSAIFNLARVVGPALAGVVISLVGTGPAFLLNAASFAAVLAGLALMRQQELHTVEPVARARGQLREGLAYVRQRRDLVMVLLLIAFIAGFGMNFQVTTALISRQVFHQGAASFGLASTMLAAGSVAGALLAARRIKPDRRILCGAAVLFGVLEIVAGLMPIYTLFLVVLVPTGLVLMTFTTAANATMQIGIAPEMRGRVMGLYMLVFLGTNPFGAPAIGWLAEVFGPRSGMVLGGVVSLVATLIITAVVLTRPAPQEPAPSA